MSPVKKKYRHLPPRMTLRSYKNKRGDVKTYYYYEHPRDENGKRKATPLGTDISIAKRKWADIEGKPAPMDLSTIAGVYERYMAWAEDRSKSGLSPRTLKDRKAYWRYLAPVYGEVTIDSIDPSHVLPYFHKRSSQISAKKEIKFLSVMFNWAIARGLMRVQNPVTGLTRQMKVNERRTIYVGDTSLWLVYKNGSDLVKDTIDILYTTGQRIGDARNFKLTDIKDGVLAFTQSKTGRHMQIAVIGKLADTINRIMSRGVVSIYILSDKKGQKLTEGGVLRNEFDHARDAAEAEAKELGIEFQRFQLRDIRAKSASDLDKQHAQDLLGHTNEQMTSSYRRGWQESVIMPVMAKKTISHQYNKKLNNGSK